jgi:organic radical activating enzyme
MEHFYTLQGEGHWAGTPAYFIRTAGCDVGCIWCDVKESWTVDEDQYMPIAELVELVKASGTKVAVVTGGEPTMYDLGPLTMALKAAGIRTHMETSGAHPFSGEWDWITLSPKKFKAAREEFYALAQELKVIVYNQHDLQWAQEQAAHCDPEQTLLYLQPEWSRREEVHRTIEFIKAHPQWKLSLQTHKYVNIP